MYYIYYYCHAIKGVSLEKLINNKRIAYVYQFFCHQGSKTEREGATLHDAAYTLPAEVSCLTFLLCT